MTRNVWLITLAVFLGLITIGLPLARLPLQIHGVPGYDLYTVGWVMGMQFIATLISRPLAGHLTDRLGGKLALTLGFVVVAVSGIFYGCSLLSSDKSVSLGLIVAGRVFTGVGEGLLITGGGAWAVSTAGIDKAGLAMSWIGLAMFGGMAAGAAAGAILSDWQMPLMMLIVAFVSMLVASPLAVSGYKADEKSLSLKVIIQVIKRPGLVLGLSAVGFSVVSSFVALVFESRDWSGGGLAVALFGLGHVTARLALGARIDSMKEKGWLPGMLAVEACGLIMIAAAPSSVIALVGATLVGLGFSMIYPLMILPVLKSIPAGSRGMAIAVYDAFFDVAMGGAALCGGLIANMAGTPGVFVFAGTLLLMGLVWISKIIPFVKVVF